MVAPSSDLASSSGIAVELTRLEEAQISRIRNDAAAVDLDALD